MGKNQVTLTFAADSASLERALARVRGESEKTATGFQKFKRAAQVGAVAVLAGLGWAAKNAFEGIKSGQQVSAQTAAALKSTGNAANTSQKQIEDLSIKLSKMSGVDDELIQKSQNLLLTFTNIRNEVGKGNRIFDRATAAALDMSVALGQDLKGSTNMLAKALNDPVKGITAMQKAGVSFSQSQKDQIKTLVESGRTLDAQKLILKELEVQYGGSAKAAGDTLAGKLNKARLAFDRVSEAILTMLLPALTKAADFGVKLTDWMERHETATKVLVGVTAGLAAGVLAVSAATKVWAAATVVVTVAQKALNLVMRANPIGIVITALAALAAGLIYAYKNSETFRRIVDGAFNAVKSAAQSVLNFFRSNWKTIAILISGPFAPIVALATNAFGVRSALVNAFNSVLGKAREVIGKVPGVITGIMGSAKSAAIEVGKAIVYGIGDGMEALKGWLIDKGRAIARAPLDAAKSVLGISSPSKVFQKEVGEQIAKGLARGIEYGSAEAKNAAIRAAKDALSAAKSAVTSAASEVSGAISKALDIRANVRIAALDNSAEGKRLREIEAIQKATSDAKEKARLDEALANAQTDAERMAAQEALNAWSLEQERQTLADTLAARQQAILDETAAKKEAVERQLADLSDGLNRGLISQKTYLAQVKAALGESGVEYEDIGRMMGTALANGFRDALSTVIGAAALVPNLKKKIGRASSGTVKTPKKRADGGLITAPEIALIGESGPELVIPLNRPRRARQLMNQSGLSGGLSIVIQNMTVRDQADIDRFAAEISRRVAMAGLT